MKKITSYLIKDALCSRKNRDQYFKAGLDYLQNNSIPGKISDKIFRLHWNVNLYIDMHSKCNGRCEFCINRVNFSRKDIPDDKYLQNLEEVLKLIRFIDPSIQIVGGEPSIHPKRLRAILDLIKRYRIRKPVITTNGSGLSNSKLLDDLESSINHINISRHHYDDEFLVKIFGFNNPLDNATLHQIMTRHPISKKIRLNCCLLKDYIDSYESIMNYIHWAMTIGVRNICFSALSKLPDNYIYQKQFLEHSKYHDIDINSIMNKIFKNKDFNFIKFHTGSHCMYEVWEYSNKSGSMIIVFSTSNNYFAQSLDNIDDLIELLVFHTNGTLAGSWNRDCKVLYN